jgi:hypothetical protein
MRQDQHEHELVTKAARRARRKKQTMKVSGANVKKLQQILIKRGRPS